MISSRKNVFSSMTVNFLTKKIYGYMEWHNVLLVILILLLDDMNTYFSNRIPHLVSRFN
jgi:hypothetical protein